jgi:hypothetical protein
VPIKRLRVDDASRLYPDGLVCPDEAVARLEQLLARVVEALRIEVFSHAKSLAVLADAKKALSE